MQRSPLPLDFELERLSGLVARFALGRKVNAHVRRLLQPTGGLDVLLEADAVLRARKATRALAQNARYGEGGGGEGGSREGGGGEGGGREGGG